MHDGYQATIGRGAPGCILFLLDVSASMTDPYEHGLRRGDFLTDAVNRTLTELAATCKRQDGVRHYFDIGIFTYNGLAARSALGGVLAGRDLVSITDLAANPLRVEQRSQRVPDGAGGLVEVPIAFPVWFAPTFDGATAMCGALRQAAKVIGGWCQRNPAGFPPIVLHITDGEATDGVAEEVVAAARQVTDQKTGDGHALLLNLHIASGGDPTRFPSAEARLPPHPFARALFQASSPLPPPLLERGFRQGLGVQPGSRGYIHNGRMEDVVAFLDIGTKAATDQALVKAAER